MINFSTIIPHEIIQLGGLTISLWVIAGLVFNLLRWRAVVESYNLKIMKNLTLSKAPKILRLVIYDILLQSNLWKCSSIKWFSHFTVFAGFIGLGVSTSLNYLMNPTAQSLPFNHPVRIIGNISGFFLILGITLILREQTKKQSIDTGFSIKSFLFIGLLYTAGVSGFFTEIFSELNNLFFTILVYWIHIISVTILIILAPFSKFIHSIGRSIVLMFENL